MEEKPETRYEMRSAHRKEISQLQVKEVAQNEGAASDCKAELIFKWKVLEYVFLPLLPALKKKYANEIALLGYESNSGTEDEEWRNRATLLYAIVGVSITSQADLSEPIKSGQKRVQQEEAERAQGVKEELHCILSERYFENERLEKKYEPFGLTIKEIRCDEHCLYRAVEDQLTVHSRGSSRYGYQELRELAAAYMKEHASDFHLCLVLTDEEINSDISRSVKVQNYLKKMDSTALFEGVQELKALAHCLKKHIMMFSASFPLIELGKEYKTGDASIFLSYHRGAFRLGPHYNSLVPRCQKKEIPQLQVKEVAQNKEAASDCKAELIFKWKVLEDVFLPLLPALKEKYANEIALLGYESNSWTDDEEWRNRATLLYAIVGVSVTSQADLSEPIKGGQKRVQQEEAERAQRIKEELHCILSERYFENERLEEKYEPFGLTFKEIKCDEHCLYRAVEDQLTVHSRGSSLCGYQELRELAAAYKKEHASDFYLCLVLTDEEIASSDISCSLKVQNYLKKWDSTALFEGVQELKALAHTALKNIL